MSAFLYHPSIFPKTNTQKSISAKFSISDMGRYSDPVHEHSLTIREKGVFKCGGCGAEEIPGQIYYWCNLCSSHFHETCAKLPLQVKHYFHPCPLFLHVSPRFFCDSCFAKHSNVFTYKCERCDFDMCVECAGAQGEGEGEGEKILHCCHRHPLKPLSLEPLESLLSCQVCNMSCSLEPTWGCEPCNYHIHKSCLDLLPEIVQLKRHSKLTTWVLRTSQQKICVYCGENFDRSLVFRSARWKRAEFLCTFCGLLISLIGESSSSGASKVINHFFHPCPNLKLIFSSSSTCNACFQSHHHFFYHCGSCGFFLCFDCATLPQLASQENEANQLVQHFCHWHPLKLITDTQDTNHICILCEKFTYEPYYSCNDQCNFYIHKSCMDSLPHKTNCHGLSHTLCLLPVPSFECTTCNQMCFGLSFNCYKLNYNFCVKCVLCPENVRVDDGRFISPHHWHLLSLYESEKNHEASCVVCERSCIGQSYRCTECSFFFHKHCAELPTQLDHPSHPQHNLTLTYWSIKNPYAPSSCDLCFEDLAKESPLFDWVYKCYQCNFQLDIRCASTLPSLEYKGHTHLLYLVDKFCGTGRCQKCNQSCFGNSIFRCAHRECYFRLHIECGPLPRKIKHDCHVHSLTHQDYYVEDNASDEFACHVCEEKRDPLRRVYCCSEGCFMNCCFLCAESEVMPVLRGEHEEVEMITPYPRVACRVINRKSISTEMMSVSSSEKDRAEDGVQQSEYAFSFKELLDSCIFKGFEEAETFGLELLEEEDKPDDKLRSKTENEEGAREERDGQYHKAETSYILEESSGTRTSIDKEIEGYPFTFKALSHFSISLRAPSFDKLQREIMTQYDGYAVTGDYAFPKPLGQIYREFFATHNIIVDECMVSYSEKRCMIFITCSILHEMRRIKVVDVEKDTILQWLGWIRFVQEKGFNVGFIAENIKEVWRAHYYIESKKIVDDKSWQLRMEVERETKRVEELRTKLAKAEARLEDAQRRENKHDTYRVEGSKGKMKRERTSALEIKWRTCYDSVITRKWTGHVE